jgi:hypothetical protein
MSISLSEIPYSSLKIHLDRRPNQPVVVRGSATAWPAAQGGIEALLAQLPQLRDDEAVSLGRLGKVDPWLSRATPLPSLRPTALVETTLVTRFADGAISALHRDYADNLHTVLHGEKSWMIAPRDTPFCVIQPGAPGGPLGPQNSIFRTFDELAVRLGHYGTPLRLRAGDTLYLPRGTWHAVESHGGADDNYGATSLVYTFFRPGEPRICRALALPFLTRLHNALVYAWRDAGSPASRTDALRAKR